MSKLTSVQKRKLMIEALSKNGGNISMACKTVGIDRQTHYNWLGKFDSYKKQVEELNEHIIDFVESKLMQNINDNDNASIFFFLKTRAKHRGYSERVEVENKEVDEFASEKVVFYIPDNGRDDDD